jgi:tetratricopeptide (TPR) repeat protein
MVARKKVQEVQGSESAMPILDDTGQSPSITEGSRALRLFTDRHQLIQEFARALHEDDALGKILIFHGGGGNGKSLLIRFLQAYACKRFHRWQELRQQPDAEIAHRLKEERSFDPMPVANLDFHAPPREFEQPMVDYDALLMLRRQLGAFSAEGLSRIHLPVYDFAALWYLHQTNRLTEERLSSLFPTEEINFVVALAQLFKEIPGAGLAQAVVGLFNKHLKEWWTFFKARRRVDQELLEEIQGMDPERDLIPEMPRLFALDLNAALSAADAPPRIVLLFDGHDAFASASGASAPEGDRDRWLRYLLAAVDLEGGVVPVVTSRRELHWEEKAHYPIPTEYLNLLLVGHFSDVDAHDYLKKAGVNDTALRARLCDYARVARNEVHPLYVGLGADVVFQAARRGHHLTAEDFPEEPDAEKKPRLLVERLLMEASENVEYAVRSLAAARAFDRQLFEKLGSWGRSRYSATDAAFDTLTQFSFVWEAETHGTGWYSIHALLRRILRERGDERLREADAALEAIYRERVEAGDRLALAEALYHAYQQERERGLREWMTAFVEAQQQSRHALCEALRTVGAELQPKEPWWRAQMAQVEADYLFVRSRYAEADEVLQTGMEAYGEALHHGPYDPSIHGHWGIALVQHGHLLEALSRHDEAERAYAFAVAASNEALLGAPDDTYAHNGKGIALAARGGLLADLSRYDEAEGVYAEAVGAYDEALRRAPDHLLVHLNKARALLQQGELVQFLDGEWEAVHALWKAAQKHAEHVLALAPQQGQAEQLLGLIREQLDTLEADSTQN